MNETAKFLLKIRNYSCKEGIFVCIENYQDISSDLMVFLFSNQDKASSSHSVNMNR